MKTHQTCMNLRESVCGNLKNNVGASIARQHGITLVALVITIITLLILAGVILNIVIGENGIIPKAQFAKLAANISQEDERQALEKMNKDLEKVGSKNEIANIEEGKFIANTPYEEGIYKVKGNRIDNNQLEETLKDTIKTVEGIEEITDSNVKLYEVENEALKKEYIFNIISGRTYQYKALSYGGKYWHRPECGINKKTGEVEETDVKAKDSTKPTIREVKVESRKTEIIITVEAEDEEKEGEETSGIEEYEYYIGGTKVNPKETDEKGKCTIEGLTPDTEYEIYVIVKDKEGNMETSETTTVKTKENDIEFSVEVNNITNTGWTQNINIANGNTNGYTIKYYYTTDATKIGSMEITDGITSTTQTNKSDLTTYYVWARATKEGKDILSSNYIELNTGHEHKGNKTSGGACYDSGTVCTGGKGYVYYIESTNWGHNTDYRYTANKRYCENCGAYVGNKSADGYGGHCIEKGPNSRKVCLNCYGSYDHVNTTYKNWVCNSCYNARKPFYKSDGTLLTNYGMESNTSIRYKCNKVGEQGNVSHRIIYNFNCTKAEKNPTKESIDF